MSNQTSTVWVFFMLLIICSCNSSTEQGSKSENSTEKIVATKGSQTEIFKNKVIIFLKENPDMDSNILDIQDFIVDGKSFIPVFTSKDKLVKSTRGAKLPYAEMEIEGLLLLSMMDGNETLRVNPELKDDASYLSAELKETFKAEIEQFLNEIKDK
jgi:ABC-type Fe3+-hydroxamate transport system substrate-binding protein